MKTAKIALAAAFVMTLLSSSRYVALLFFSARHLSRETNRALQGTGNEQTNLLEQMQAGLHQQFIHQYQIAIYKDIIGLAWNLLLAGLLIFAISRIQKGTLTS